MQTTTNKLSCLWYDIDAIRTSPLHSNIQKGCLLQIYRGNEGEAVAFYPKGRTQACRNPHCMHTAKPVSTKARICRRWAVFPCSKYCKQRNFAAADSSTGVAVWIWTDCRRAQAARFYYGGAAKGSVHYYEVQRQAVCRLCTAWKSAACRFEHVWGGPRHPQADFRLQLNAGTRCKATWEKTVHYCKQTATLTAKWRGAGKKLLTPEWQNAMHGCC